MHFCIFGYGLGQLGGWLVVRLAGKLVGWLSGWLAGRLAVWLAGWLAHWLGVWQAGWRFGKFTGWPVVCLSGWLAGLVAGRPACRLAGWLAGWLEVDARCCRLRDKVAVLGASFKRSTQKCFKNWATSVFLAKVSEAHP